MLKCYSQKYVMHIFCIIYPYLHKTHIWCLFAYLTRLLCIFLCIFSQFYLHEKDSSELFYHKIQIFSYLCPLSFVCKLLIIIWRSLIKSRSRNYQYNEDLFYKVEIVKKFKIVKEKSIYSNTIKIINKIEI